jgi:hypothetical protein
VNEHEHENENKNAAKEKQPAWDSNPRGTNPRHEQSRTLPLGRLASAIFMKY